MAFLNYLFSIEKQHNIPMNNMIPPTIILIPRKFSGILYYTNAYTNMSMASTMKKIPPKVIDQGTTFRGKNWRRAI